MAKKIGKSDDNIRQLHYLYAVEFKNKRILRPESMALVLGRSKSADFVISSAKVARKHCKIIFSGGSWKLHNLSPEGTSLLERTLQQDDIVELKSEDILKIGGIFLQCKLKVESGEPPRRVLTILGLIGDEHCSLVAESKDQPDEPVSRITFERLDKSVNEILPGNSKIEEIMRAKDDIIENLTSENNHVMMELMEVKSALRKALVDKGEAELRETQMKEQLTLIQENKLQVGALGEAIETELLCSVCNDMIIDAVTLDCSHTLCGYCLEQWKKKNKICPLCRSKIHYECKSRVIDSLVEKVMEHFPEETQIRRKELVDSRKASKKRSTRSNPGRSKRKRVTIQLDDTSSDMNDVLRISFNYSATTNETIEIISSDDDIL